MNGELKAGLILSAAILIIVLTSFFLVPSDYNAIDSGLRFIPPGWEHPLGTDNFGRDILFRLLAGSRYTIVLAVCTVAAAAVMGSLFGLFAGYSGGIFDEIVMRLMDAVSSFPGILFALVMAALMGNSQSTLFIALLILFIPSFTRIMRGGALQYKSMDFILAERLIKASHARIMFIHIVPNLTPSLLPAAALGLSNAILAEAAMSYLGLGIQPPLPSWGRMLSESQNFLYNAPWCALAPGAFIMLTVIAFHCLGDGLRRRLGE
ncbi:MAG: ABC transporter permease [Treponema sp.]|jgi:peptide/nickel transport system permease protein|nr:ABC transporter permease [Treponema sp.]